MQRVIDRLSWLVNDCVAGFTIADLIACVLGVVSAIVLPWGVWVVMMIMQLVTIVALTCVIVRLRSTTQTNQTNQTNQP